MIVADGVYQTAVTPHFSTWNPDLIATVATLSERLDHLRHRLIGEGIALELFPGAEHFLTPELVELVKAGDAPLLGPGPYILVELPFNDRPLYADDVLYQLAMAGVQPVLAHPERYSWVQADPSAIETVADRGIILQLTSASITGHYGNRIRKTGEQILSRGLYGLVGSDLHRPGQPRTLSRMEEAVTEIAGPEAARVLFEENPRRVLRGDVLMHVPVVERENMRRGLFRLFG